MKSYKYKIRRPSKRVVAAFEQTLEVCRELYNAALKERSEAWTVCRKSVGYKMQAAQLTEIRSIREDTAWVYSQVTQDVLRRIEKAFDAYFRRVKTGKEPGYPRYKSVRRYKSFTYPQSGFRLEGNKLTLSRIGSLRLRLSRPVEGRIKTCTIKCEIDGWYVIFAVEENQSRWLPKTGKSIGIDLGIENFATLSTGEQIENPQFYRKSGEKLKKAQRRLSRRKKWSVRRRKAAIQVAKIHQKIARQRLHFFHKKSLELVKKSDHFVFEDLNIEGLMKNHHLAKSISDAAWGTFIQIHSGKAVNAGRHVEKVPARFTLRANFQSPRMWG